MRPKIVIIKERTKNVYFSNLEKADVEVYDFTKIGNLVGSDLMEFLTKTSEAIKGLNEVHKEETGSDFWSEEDGEYEEESN